MTPTEDQVQAMAGVMRRLIDHLPEDFAAVKDAEAILATLPKPVDADLLAAREWLKARPEYQYREPKIGIDLGHYDQTSGIAGFLAGAALMRQPVSAWPLTERLSLSRAGSTSLHPSPHPRRKPMIEELARALANGMDVDPDVFIGMHGRKAFERCYYPAVRAILTRLREPTEEMLAAAVPEPTHLYGEGSRGAEYQRDMKAAVAIERAVLASQYHAMLDAISPPLDSGRG